MYPSMFNVQDYFINLRLSYFTGQKLELLLGKDYYCIFLCFIQIVVAT